MNAKLLSTFLDRKEFFVELLQLHTRCQEEKCQREIFMHFRLENENCFFFFFLLFGSLEVLADKVEKLEFKDLNK